MMDRDIAQQLAREFKIDLFTVYREYLQILFLRYFYRKKESRKVYFKGGTAIRFLYGSFRFSEDLDFTALISVKHLEEMILDSLEALKKETPEVRFEHTETIANSFSGRIFQQLPDFKFPLTIRLDFSLREKPVLPVALTYLETVFPVTPYPLVCHLQPEEILAEKVRATLIRSRGRDLFDLWFLLSKKVSLDWNLVNKKMALYNRKASQVELLKKLEEFPQDEIKSDLTRFLPSSHRRLIKDIKGLILEKVRSF